MEMWLSDQPSFFKETPIRPLVLTECSAIHEALSITMSIENEAKKSDEMDEANDNLDRLIAYELSNKEDFISFCDQLRDQNIAVRAIYDPTVTPALDED